MRFRFCGDLDCPDWVLAEISTLAKLSSVKMKLLCAQVLKDLLGEGIDYDKVAKLTADAKFESGDIKASVAVLSFILSSAAKHDVDSESLSSELQQLGLPKDNDERSPPTPVCVWCIVDNDDWSQCLPASTLVEFADAFICNVCVNEHTTGLCKSYEDKHSALQDKLRETSLRLGRLDAVSWRVDYTLSSSELREVNEPVIQLKLQAQGAVSGSSETTVVTVSADKFRVLLAELKQAQAMMNALQ